MAQFRGVDFVVVVEDEQLANFVKKVFKVFGVSYHKLRIRQDFPRHGKGSGKQYVDSAFPREVRTLRQKRGENRALLIATEADEQSLQQRVQSLEESLADSGAPPRGKDERVAYWVPKWHIETWGLHLSGREVGEDEPCKNLAGEIRWNEAGKRFAEEYNRSKKEPVQSLPSLLSAYAETVRMSP